MILDTLTNASRYELLHPLFPAAFEFLRGLRPSLLQPGTFQIQGEHLYAIVARMDPAPRSPLRLEAHRRYIDLQIALEGEFPLGWRPLRHCKRVGKRYSAKDDVAFFDDPVATTITLTPGVFAILFPEDAHAPGLPSSPLVKVVLKIQYEADVFTLQDRGGPSS